MNSEYTKYSLDQLKNWMYDVTDGEASPQEIYDVIKGVVDEQYCHHKLYTNRCYELLALLNGNGTGHIQAYDDYKSKTDKVIKWVLPVEVSDDLEDYIVTFPDDLLEAANLKEGDCIEWIDNNDGSFTLKKIETT